MRIESDRLLIEPRSQTYEIANYINRVDINTKVIGTDFVSFTAILKQQGDLENPFTVEGWAFPCTFSNGTPVFDNGIDQLIIEFTSADKGQNWSATHTTVYAEGYSAPAEEPPAIVRTPSNALISSTITDLEDIGDEATVLQFSRTETTYTRPNTQDQVTTKVVGEKSIQLGVDAAAIGSYSFAALGGVAIANYSLALLGGICYGESTTYSIAILGGSTAGSNCIAFGPGCVIESGSADSAAIGNAVRVNGTGSTGVGTEITINHSTCVGLGRGVVSRLIGSLSHSATWELQQGDTQYHEYTLVATTNNTSPIEMTTNGLFTSNNNIHYVPANGVGRYEVFLVGIGPNNASFSQRFDVQISNEEVFSQEVGPPISINGSGDTLFEGTYLVKTISGPDGTGFTIEVASPEPFHRIRWAARVKLVELLL